MATARSEELGRLARRFAAALPEAFDEVLLTGSVSRGDADELSDVELLLVAPELPDLRSAGLEILEGNVFLGGAAAWYTFSFEGELFETGAWTHARTEERLAGILAGRMIDHGQIRTAEAIVHGLPLRTAGAVARWQERLAVYPEELVEAIVLAASEEWLEQPQGIRAHLRPGGRLPLALLLAQDMQNVLRIVFALNRAWEPSWKRLPRTVEPLAVKPERLAERVEEALAEPDARTALRGARELVLDTLALAPSLPPVVRARERTAELVASLR